MSRRVMQRILDELYVRLSVKEEDELYRELLHYFGLVGAVDDCQALENAWMDPYVKSRIKQFIEAWLKARRRQVVYVV